MTRINKEKPIHNHVELTIGFIEASKIASEVRRWQTADFSVASLGFSRPDGKGGRPL